MSKKVWNPERDAMLISLNDKYCAKKIAELMGLTEKSIQSRRKRIGLQKDRRTVWNDEKEAYLREHYSNTKIKDLIPILGLSEKTIKSKSFRLGLSKTDEFKRRMGLEGNFQNGHQPWNQGLKGLSFGGSSSQFKKGMLPHNTKEDGAITIRTDKQGNHHEHIRISLGNWIPFRHKVWIDHHGPIPKGHIVRVIDGDTMNSNIEKLEMISKKENRIRNAGVRDLSDSYVAQCLAGRKFANMRDAFLKHPELIQLKRLTLQTKRLCQQKLKEHSEG